MLECRSGVYGYYLYRDGEYFDEVIFIDWYRKEFIASSGVVYDMDSIRNEVFLINAKGGIQPYVMG